LPDIESSIWQKYADQGVLVYGIHQNESPALLADFLEQTGVTFPIEADRGTLSKLAFPPGVGYPYPRDVVIGKDLVVRSIKNSFNASEMDALVQSLLAE
jgi:hypothetical protein